jgi:hypothetical protein
MSAEDAAEVVREVNVQFIGEGRSKIIPPHRRWTKISSGHVHFRLLPYLGAVQAAHVLGHPWTVILLSVGVIGLPHSAQTGRSMGWQSCLDDATDK